MAKYLWLRMVNDGFLLISMKGQISDYVKKLLEKYRINIILKYMIYRCNLNFSV